jgi:hypothetical protein
VNHQAWKSNTVIKMNVDLVQVLIFINSVQNQPDADRGRLNELDDFEGLHNVYQRSDNN